MADLEWRRLCDSKTDHGITSDERINALPCGTAGVTAFTTYSTESLSRGTT